MFASLLLPLGRHKTCPCPARFICVYLQALQSQRNDGDPGQGLKLTVRQGSFKLGSIKKKQFLLFEVVR